MVGQLPTVRTEIEVATVQVHEYLSRRLLLTVITLQRLTLCLRLLNRLIAVLTAVSTETVHVTVLTSIHRLRAECFQLFRTVSDIKPTSITVVIQDAVVVAQPLLQIVNRTAHIARTGTPRGSRQVIDLATPSSDTHCCHGKAVGPSNKRIRFWGLSG